MLSGDINQSLEGERYNPAPVIVVAASMVVAKDLGCILGSRLSSVNSSIFHHSSPFRFENCSE